MPQKRMECFWLLLEHLAWIEHQFLSGIRDSRKSVRDDEKCGRSKEVRTPELIVQIKNFTDKDRRVSIETISSQFDFSMGTVHTIMREELKMRKICEEFVPRVLREVQKERRRYDSRMLWWPAMKAGSTAMTQRPRERVSSGSMLALPSPRRPDRANPPTNFSWSLFLTTLAWSTCTEFPLDRQSTRNTMLMF